MPLNGESRLTAPRDKVLPNLDQPANEVCSLLVLSCDAYSDLWRPFFTLFWRFWKDCPFKVYLGSNTIAYSDPKVKTLLAGHGGSWSSEFGRQLQMIDTPYVLLCLEDFFFRRDVPTERLLSVFNLFRHMQGHMLRLVRNPGPDRAIPETSEFGVVDIGTPYRVSMQASVWRRETLAQLLSDRESIWEFEMSGSLRSAMFEEGFFTVYDSILPYDHHVVERGKWFPVDAKTFGRLHIGCDFSRRPIMTTAEFLSFKLRNYRSRVLSVLPSGTRQRVVRMARSLWKLSWRTPAK